MFFVTVNNVKTTLFPLRLAVRIAIGTALESAGVERLNTNGLALVGEGIHRRQTHHLSKIAPVHYLTACEQVPAHLERAHLKSVVCPT